MSTLHTRFGRSFVRSWLHATTRRFISPQTFHRTFLLLLLLLPVFTNILFFFFLADFFGRSKTRSLDLDYGGWRKSINRRGGRKMIRGEDDEDEWIAAAAVTRRRNLRYRWRRRKRVGDKSLFNSTTRREQHPNWFAKIPNANFIMENREGKTRKERIFFSSNENRRIIPSRYNKIEIRRKKKEKKKSCRNVVSHREREFGVKTSGGTHPVWIDGRGFDHRRIGRTKTELVASRYFPATRLSEFHYRSSNDYQRLPTKILR